MKCSTWKPRKKREVSVRVGRHGERRVQFLAGMSLYTLTPFIPLLIHFGSSSTREKLHSFSYSSRSNILMVMIFLWEHKTKAKQMVGVARSCQVFTKLNVTVMLWRETWPHMDLPEYVKGHHGCSQLAPIRFSLLIYHVHKSFLLQLAVRRYPQLRKSESWLHFGIASICINFLRNRELIDCTEN